MLFHVEKKVSMVVLIIGLFVTICPIIKIIYGKSVKSLVNICLTLYTFLLLCSVVLFAAVASIDQLLLSISIIVVIINIYLIIKDHLKR